jgi:hypothetical protein
MEYLLELLFSNSANYMLTLPLKLVRRYLLSLTCLEPYEELTQGLHVLEYLLATHLIERNGCPLTSEVTFP